MENGSASDQDRQLCCFMEWLSLQHQDLSELLQAQTLDPNLSNDCPELRQLVRKNIQHFQDYIERRNPLARADVSAFFAPSWCTSLENSLLWIAGCRPSIFIRLVYGLCGIDFESQLTAFLNGARTGRLTELSASQLEVLDALQRKTVKEEDKLSSELASLHEQIADQPLAGIVVNGAGQVGEPSCDSDKALDDHGACMAKLLSEADQLRLNTLNELIGILTPVQSIEYLVASKKLFLCIREWGGKRDRMHGRK